MNSNQDQEREAFEAWYLTGINNPHLEFFHRQGDGYVNPIVNCAWKAWDHRASLQGQQSSPAPASREVEEVIRATMENKGAKSVAKFLSHLKPGVGAPLDTASYGALNTARKSAPASRDEALMDAAEAKAALYNDDPRDCIKTDVMNAFYAGAAFEAGRAVEFTDQWGARHTMSPEMAALELREFHNEWPGGLPEIESALNTARKGARASEPNGGTAHLTNECKINIYSSRVCERGTKGCAVSHVAVNLGEVSPVLDAGLAACQKDAPPDPKLVLALPDWETRKIVIASDEVIDGERIVCVAIQDHVAGKDKP